ncbi:DEKNAAC101133 [Brettanomyces naardenensis]|uniref:DEKNAAC101133 n=1 Tax=Brettanomyces naardenensis TaxID=13370 RepID=A0A448YHA0_BRENA|nr:DEKNAAC101133 [Brettanomyces naardenensis]
MAILTGDSAYCADCFKCKSCKKPIEDLRYARTSKGLFCMSCHKILMDKKKKYERMKKARERRDKFPTRTQRKRPSFIPSPDGPSPTSSTSSSRLVSRTISDSQTSSTRSQINSNGDLQTPVSSSTHTSTSQDKKLEDALSDPREDEKVVSSTAVSSSSSSDLMSSAPPEPRAAPPQVPDPNSVDPQNVSTPPSHAPPHFSSTPHKPSPHPVSAPPSTTMASSSRLDSQIRSPLRQPLQSSLSSHQPPQAATPKPPTSTGVTPAYRQTRFVEQEPESFIDLDDDDDDDDDDDGDVDIDDDANEEIADLLQIDVTQQQNQTLSPGFVPSTYQDAGLGLNIHGVTYRKAGTSNSAPTSASSATFKVSSPPTFSALGNLADNNIGDVDGKAIVEGEKWKDFKVRKSPFRFGVVQSPDNSSTSAAQPPSSPSHSRKSSATLGRSLTHVFRRHRKGESTAGGGSNTDASTIGTTRSDSSPKHLRSQSEHSTSVYATPPLPSSADSFHNRSFSESLQENLREEDAAGLLRERSIQISQAERELRLMKSEINSLTSAKASMLRDLQNLQSQKRALNLELSEKQNQIRELDIELSETRSRLSDTRSHANTSKSSLQDADLPDLPESAQVKQPQQQQQTPMKLAGNGTSNSTNASISTANTSLTSNASTVTNGSNGAFSGTPSKKTGFMRRFFGGSQQAGYVNGSTSSPSLPNSISSHSISAPINFKQGDEALQIMRGHLGISPLSNKNWDLPDEPLSVSPTPQKNALSSGLGSMIRSRSQNFLQLRTNNLSGDGTAGLSPIPASPSGNPGLYGLTLQQRSEFESRKVPYIVTACLSEVSRRGLVSEGIYRVSGSALAIDKIERFFGTTDATDSGSPTQLSKQTAAILDTDVNAVAGMLKRYLKKLPDPVIPFNQYEHFIELSRLPSDRAKVQSVQKLISNLPPTNQQVLKLLLEHLNAVAANEQYTKMTVSALATVFAPTLARDNGGNPQREILDNGAKTRATEFLLRSASTLIS